MLDVKDKEKIMDDVNKMNEVSRMSRGYWFKKD